jgi:hypothetical protein
VGKAISREREVIAELHSAIALERVWGIGKRVALDASFEIELRTWVSGGGRGDEREGGEVWTDLRTEIVAWIKRAFRR